MWRVAVHQQHVQRAAEGERAGQIELVVEPRVGAAQFHRHYPVTKHRQVARVGDETQGIGVSGGDKAGIGDRTGDGTGADKRGVGVDEKTVGKAVRAAKQIQRGCADTVANLKQRAVIDRAAAAVEHAAVESHDTAALVGEVKSVDDDCAAVERQRAVANVECTGASSVGCVKISDRNRNDVANRITVADDDVGGGHCAAVGERQTVEGPIKSDI